MHFDRTGGSAGRISDSSGDAGSPGIRYGSVGNGLRLTFDGRVVPVRQGAPAGRPTVESAAESAAGPFRADPDRLSATLSGLARKHRIPGAQVAVHYRGETIAAEAGKLEYGSRCPVSSDAAFPIGSITKSFTATTAMILVADGDLELDAPLNEHLPELGNHSDDFVTPLTLRHLLSHTSGLTDGPDEIAAASLQRYVLDYCRKPELVLPPGTGFSYSNIGYVLAGHLIEVITGMSWWEAVESIVLRPLGIEPTFIVAPEPGRSERPIATGHSVNAMVGRTRPVEQSLALAEAPAGALAVSAVDLVALGLTQVDGRTPSLLPTSYAEQMREAVPAAEPFGLADGWGLGLAMFRSGSTEWVGHDGNADGTACYLRVDPEEGCVVAFTSNANLGVDLWQELVTELNRMGLPIKNYSAADALGPATLPPPGCVGKYWNGDIEYAVTAQKNGTHHLAIDDEAVARLEFHEGLIFTQHDPNSGQFVQVGRFLRNPITGDLDLIQIAGRLGRRQIRDAYEARKMLARAVAV
jgi:CubicO group peptidase (beta-lactamase class C family)